ncbi:MAG: sigma-54 dependent transcriptional regulator [Pseudomonadota bacterium]
MPKILLIDDEQPILESLEMFFSEKGHRTITAASAGEGIQAFDAHSPDVVILDIHLPDRSGYEVLDYLGARPDPPKIIMITAYHDMGAAIRSIKGGAYDYIHKPLDADEIEASVEKALRTLAAEKKSAPSLKIASDGADNLLIGKSRPMMEVFKMIGVLCQGAAAVLIQGETGTGKELIARVIHQNSPNSREPFITVDCSAVVESLLESELFGHEKGAFTGATKTKLGKIELSGRGALFLDEIGELPLGLQSKLLGFLERREFFRVGGQFPQQAHCRIIAATNRDLNQMVQKGLLRQDVFYRLKVVTLHVPPLRERLEDIPDLAGHFLQKFSQAMGKPFLRLQDGVISRLMSHHWTGNVRELKNVILAAVVRSRGSVILLEEVEKVMFANQADQVAGPGSDPALADMERRHILRVLGQVKWNRTQAARLLGVSLPTLRSKIRKYRIDPSSPD